MPALWNAMVGLKKTVMQKFYFNTGVKPEMGNKWLEENAELHGTYVLPFWVDDVPKGSSFVCISSYPGLIDGNVIRVIREGYEKSKYAYFKNINIERDAIYG